MSLDLRGTVTYLATTGTSVYGRGPVLMNSGPCAATQQKDATLLARFGEEVR